MWSKTEQAQRIQMPKAPTLKARANPPASQGNDLRNTITLRVPIAKTVY